MTDTRNLLDLTFGQLHRLPPEAQKNYYRMLLRMWGIAESAALQSEHQKDHDEEIADQYRGGAREYER